MSRRSTGWGAPSFGMVRLLGVGTVVVGAVAGCAAPSPPTVCAASAVSPFPVVQVDVSAWTRSHPQATLRACADAHCVSYPTGEVGARLYVPTPPGTDPHRVVSVTLTADRAGQRVLKTNTRVWLVHHTTQDPCGSHGWWTASVTLTAVGQLRPG